MPFSSGTFSLASGNPVTTGTTISSTWANNTLSDIASGLSSCVLKDGTQVVTANIPMGGFKFTGLVSGSASGDSLSYTQLFVTASGVLAIPGSISAAGNIKANGNADVSGSSMVGTTLFIGTTVSASGAFNMAQAAALTATSTVAIGAMSGNYAVITGTATISSFDSIRAGTMRVLEFSGATPIDHNATLILPNAVKVVASAGQVAMAVSEGAGTWRLTNLFPTKQPTVQVFTTGSGTYTTPTGTTRILVKMVGPGGGGGAQATNAGANGGSATTFGTLSAGAGVGASAGAALGGAGGTSSGGDINLTGQAGNPGITNSATVGVPGGSGGNAPFIGASGAGGLASSAGGNAPANSGGGGGGGGGTTAPAPSGPGGGGGGYCEKLITSPSTSYSYVVGVGGTGGAAGGAAGGNGASGLIWVTESYD